MAAKRGAKGNVDWKTLEEACLAFVQPDGNTQSAAHITRMHWYVASRLVLEGGFLPETIKPRPPFKVRRSAKKILLEYDPSVANGSEATIFGGMKTKNVDVVVSVDGIGPVVAVSMKGTFNAYRNLTNRMEEAVGDCTNLHMSYPGLVYGFLHLMRGYREGPIPKSGLTILKPDVRTGFVKRADTAFQASGEISPSIKLYSEAMSRLTGRNDLRDDITRYEAVGLLLISPDDASIGEIVTSFPPKESPLFFKTFFSTLYEQYDRRFVYGAPLLRTVTRRQFWHPESPALEDIRAKGVELRVSEEDEDRFDEADVPEAEVKP